MASWRPVKYNTVGIHDQKNKGLEGDFDIMFMVSKTGMAIFKKDTFSRILSNFEVNFCANPPVRVKFWKKSTLKSLSFLAWNPHLGILKDRGHACLCLQF